MNPKVLLMVGGLVIVLLGTGVGFLVARNQGQVAGSSAIPEAINTATEVGLTDTKTFRDSAQGTIQDGGINGEGTHQLVREGGVSQTVYLVSSVVDLDQFIGRKAEVWGETVQAQKAGWLMDVGRVKILE